MHHRLYGSLMLIFLVTTAPIGADQREQVTDGPIDKLDRKANNERVAASHTDRLMVRYVGAIKLPAGVDSSTQPLMPSGFFSRVSK